MPATVSLFLKKILPAKPKQSFVLAILLGGLICATNAALAGTIRVGHPKFAKGGPQIGTVKFQITDTSTNPATSFVVTVTVKNGETCTVKAVHLYDALVAANKDLNLTIKPPDETHSREVGIENAKQGLIIVKLPGDTTGEEEVITVKIPPTGPVDPWLWTFTIWPTADANSVVPAGTVMTMTAQRPGRITFPVSVTGDGVLTVAQLQQLAMNQFQALGISFTEITDPLTGLTGFMSQSFTGTNLQGGGRVELNAAWSTYLGGAGVQGAPAP